MDRTPYVQRALDSGVVVEQAKGVIAARHDVDVATWFERRRRYARSHLRPLYDVARGVVDGDLQL
ncbi:MAG TPA: ANTAR domain-containing protein [Nitriliruptorales bacterium]|nr:ANTAR domain-containing protein [Nitriliruptorales bacterium]